MTPNAASSPREEPNGLEDSVNGAPPAKRPHSPAEEEQAKRHKDAEVSFSMYVIGMHSVLDLKEFDCGSSDIVLFFAAGGVQ